MSHPSEQTYKENEIQLAAIQKELDNQIDFIKTLKRSLNERIPGTIRRLQRQIKDAKEDLHTLRCRRDMYLNGGVW